jgi:hypothetical protein
MTPTLPYRQVWLCDFEFHSLPSEKPVPLCCVARELFTGRVVRHWLTDDAPMRPPFEVGADSLVVAYYASAELGCFQALGWPLPARILDLYAEFRCLTSGLPVPGGRGLLGALTYFGLDGMAAVEKEAMRQLAVRGGSYTADERMALLDYCQEDVDALARLLPAMLPHIDFPRSLLRGRYTAAVARMEWTGVPVDVETLSRLRENWGRIKGRLVSAVNRSYGVYVPLGRRPVDPETALGAAIIEEATRQGVDPDQLAAAADVVWAEERDADADGRDARRAARKATGLTQRAIDRWEDAGKDHTSWVGLDVKARELAGAHPALGIGRGYADEWGEDRTDHAAQLWGVLRNRSETIKPRHDPDILRRAAEMVAASPGEDHGPMAFSSERWAAYLAKKGIPWPRLPSGALALDDDIFRQMARAYPAEVAPIRELRHALGQLRLNELAVGSDGRCRCLLSPFSSKTGRNQPSNTRFVFGPSVWLRSLIKPPPGRAVAYVDWSAQELGIAAKLSGDTVMQDAYLSGDPYIFLARAAGAVPADATKKTHPAEREQFKVVSLGVLYGLTAVGIGCRLNQPPCRGRELLQLHQQTFHRFWEWSEQVEMEAMLTGRLQTVFGWRVHVPPGLDPKTGRPLANPRSLRNFPMQAHGSEMLRLACCLATEGGIAVCAPVHDALLVEGPVDEIEAVVAATQQAMREASGLVLPGFPLRTDARIVRHPDRYQDERGRRMWVLVTGLMEEVEREPPLAILQGGW